MTTRNRNAAADSPAADPTAGPWVAAFDLTIDLPGGGKLSVPAGQAPSSPPKGWPSLAAIEAGFVRRPDPTDADATQAED